MDPDLLPPALFRKLYKRIYRPSSGCPDVEISGVLHVMVDLLVETGLCVDCENPAATWALAYVIITNEATHPGDIRASWVGKVPSYMDKDGSTVPRSHEEYFTEMDAKDQEMAEAIKELIGKGILIEVDGLLRRPV